MIDNYRAEGGDGSVNVAGINNTVNHFATSSTQIKRSYIFEICQQIIAADIPINEEASYSLDFPSDWDEKLEYNQVERYAEVFHEEIEAYNVVDDIMSEFSNRAKLVESIRSIYLRLDNRSETGDVILDKVFDELMSVVDAGDFSVEHKMYNEDKMRAVKLIMFYAITKCQLLRRVEAS